MFPGPPFVTWPKASSAYRSGPASKNLNTAFSLPAEAGSKLAIRVEHDVVLLEQGEPILAEAEENTYEVMAA